MSDATWDAPTDEMRAALLLVRTRLRLHTKRSIRHYSHRFGMNDIRLAEVVLFARDSLWYAQALAWSEMAPQNVSVDPFWFSGLKALLALIDRGYDPERGWWSIPDYWSEKEKALNLYNIADTILMLRQVRLSGRSTVSATFEIVADIILGTDWEKIFREDMDRIRERTRATPQPTAGQQDDAALALQ